nr:U-box domain-containing protein 52-like isoform X1 [Coffea arabica]
MKTEMEEDNQVDREEQQYHHWQVKSPEIVEIPDESKSILSSRNGQTNDVYVAVGKDDLHVVQWVLDNAVSPGTRLFLVHVFPPITYINTPVGRLSRSQLSQDQLRVYLNEDQNRRKYLLEKYIRMCNDAKVPVDTMLLESNATAKAILGLIPVVNITNLVMGTKRSPFTRQLMKGQGKGEYVQKNAPECCEVTIVYNGRRIINGQLHPPESIPSNLVSGDQRPETTHNSERNFFDCICFSGKFD